MDTDTNVVGTTQQVQTSVAESTAQSTVQSAQAQVQTQRVFTQDELNAIIGDRVKTYKSDIQKLTEDVALSRKEKSELEAKFQDLDCVNSLRASNVSEEYLDFVKFEAGKLVKDGKDFKAALVDYLKEHPQYVSGASTTATKDDKSGKAGGTKEQMGIKGSTSGHGSSVSSSGSSSADAYDAILRKKGYIK